MELIQNLLRKREKIKFWGNISLFSVIIFFAAILIFGILSTIVTIPYFNKIYFILCFVTIALASVYIFLISKFDKLDSNIRKETQTFIISKLKENIGDDNIFCNISISLPRLSKNEFILLVRSNDIKESQLSKWLNPIVDNINYTFAFEFIIYLHIL